MNKISLYTILFLIFIPMAVYTQSNEKKSETINIEEKNISITEDTTAIIRKYSRYEEELLTPNNLKNIPIRGISRIIEMSPGVIIQDNKIHFRAGQSGEVGYYLNGVSASDPMNNRRAVSIIDEAVEEIQVLTGHYSADMGGANSGVVKIEMKTGGSELHGSIDARTDGFRDPTKGEKVLNTYNYGHNLVVATLGGPLISDKIRFFVAGEMNNHEDDAVRFSKGFKFENRIDDWVGLSNDDIPDTMDLIYPDGFTPKQKDNYYSINGTVTLDLPIKVKLGAMYTGREYARGDDPMLTSLNSRTYAYKTETMMLTGKLTKFFSSKSFLELRGSYYKYHRESNDSWFGNDWKKYYDSTAVADYTLDKYGDSSQVVHYRDAWRDQYDYYFNGFTMERNGDPTNLYLDQEREFFEIAGDFSTQYGKHHEIKLGGTFKQSTVRTFSLAPSVIKYADSSSCCGYDGIENIPPYDWFWSGSVHAYGYDLYGNKTDKATYYGPNNTGVYTDAPKRPVQASAYLMDKIEYKDLVINAGLRFEYYDGDDYELTDPANPIIVSYTGMFTDSSWVKKDPSIVISPRIGLSFPVSNKMMLYFKYGKFVQMPDLNNIYFSSYTYVRQIILQGYYFQDPVGFGLDPLRTTSYEVGFKRKIFEYSMLDVNVFFKNTTNLVSEYEQQISTNSTICGSYNRFVNDGNSIVKGLELKYILREIGRFNGFFNYTYMISKMRTSVGENLFSMNPMDFSQKHTGSINLDYHFGDKDGGLLLQNFGANILFKFSSGHSFTKTSYSPSCSNSYDVGVDYMYDTRAQILDESVNASTTPWTYTTDLKIDKAIKLGGLTTTFYVVVNNVFNRKNIINVYQETGSAVDDGFISNPNRLQYVSSYSGGQDYIDMYNAINIVNGQSYLDILNKELFGHPRQIFFGVKVSF